MPQTQKQTIQTDLLIWQTVATAVQKLATPIDVYEKMEARIKIYFGLDSATTPVGAEFLIQTSDKSTGNDAWVTCPGGKIITPVTAPTAVANDVDQAAGTGDSASPILCGASVPALGDLIFFKNADISKCEIGVVVARVTTGGSESYTLRHPLTNAQVAGTYYTQAQKYDLLVNVSGARRLTIVDNNNYAASAPTHVVRASLVTFDSVQWVA